MEREDRWDKCKEDAGSRMSELSEYFSGDKPLTRVEQNKDLQRWFNNIAGKIRSLDIEDSTGGGRRMQQLISALEEVEQYLPFSFQMYNLFKLKMKILNIFLI